MNTIFALSMVAGVGLTTGTPVIGARVAEEMWAADSSRHGRGSGRKDLARTSYKTARRAVRQAAGPILCPGCGKDLFGRDACACTL